MLSFFKTTKNINFNLLNGYLLLLFTTIFPISRAVASIFTVYFSLYFIFNLVSRKIPKKFLLHPLVISISLYILYMFSSNIWNGIDDKILGIKYLQWLSIFGIGLYLVRNPKYIYRVISAFILGMFISEVLSYGIYFGFWSINGATSSMPVPFMHHIMYSMFLAVTAILLLNRLLDKEYDIKSKIFLSLFFVSISFNLFITNGRIGQLSFIVAILVTFFLHYKIKIFTFIISMFFVLSLVFTAYKLSPNFQNRITQAKSDIENISHNNLNNSIGLRVAMIKASPYIIKKHIMFGVGVGGIKSAMQTLFAQNDLNFSKPVQKFLINHHLHNQYLQTTTEGGIVGLFLMLMIFYNLFRIKIDDNELKHISILFGVIYLIGFVGDPMLIKQFTYILFILFMGLFIGATFKKAN